MAANKPVGIFLRFICLAIVMLSCHKSMTEPELKAYLVNDDNGLRKHIDQHGVKASLTYFPTALVAREMEEAKGLDSIDYFLLEFGNVGREFELGVNEAKLIASRDTIEIFDVVKLPGFNTTTRAASYLTAFKSNIKDRSGDRIIFMIDGNTQFKVEEAFEIKNIRQIQKINLSHND
jgi:hypothetical protein